MEIIGFIGLGVMGLPMTKRLIQTGHELFVYDLDPKPLSILEELGAKRCESPKDLASRADIAISTHYHDIRTWNKLDEVVSTILSNPLALFMVPFLVRLRILEQVLRNQLMQNHCLRAELFQ